MKLIIEDDGGQRTVVPFDDPEMIIGRQEGSSVRLDERNVSRRHAKLIASSGSIFVEDLDSYNGVKVNGNRIAGKVVVKFGDRIQVGDFGLSLQAGDAESSELSGPEAQQAFALCHPRAIDPNERTRPYFDPDQTDRLYHATATTPGASCHAAQNFRGEQNKEPEAPNEIFGALSSNASSSHSKHDRLDTPRDFERAGPHASLATGDSGELPGGVAKSSRGAQFNDTFVDSGPKAKDKIEERSREGAEAFGQAEHRSHRVPLFISGGVVLGLLCGVALWLVLSRAPADSQRQLASAIAKPQSASERPSRAVQPLSIESPSEAREEQVAEKANDSRAVAVARDARTFGAAKAPSAKAKEPEHPAPKRIIVAKQLEDTRKQAEEARQKAAVEANSIKKEPERAVIIADETPKPAMARQELKQGIALVKSGRSKEAIVRFVRAIELDPTYAEPHLWIASGYNALGRAEGANYDEKIAHHYEEFIRLSPNHSQIGEVTRWLRDYFQRNPSRKPHNPDRLQ